MSSPKATFYLQAGAQLSQGDIVRDVPWGLIPDPVTVCRPGDPNLTAGKGFYAPFVEVKRGGLAFGKDRHEQIHARAKLNLGIVLWHDCEIDKFEEKKQPPGKWFAGVAPVLPRSLLADDIWQGIEAGERLQYFHLPAAPPSLPDSSYADLRHVWPVKQSLLQNRVLTLSDESRMALYHHLFSFLTHKRVPNSLQRPTCGGAIDPAILLEKATNA